MSLAFVSSFVVMVASDDCVPQYKPFPRSCVDCSAKVTPQFVPVNVSKLWGVWYTVASEANAHDPDFVCTQLNFAPRDASNLFTEVDYLSSFNKGGQPTG